MAEELPRGVAQTEVSQESVIKTKYRYITCSRSRNATSDGTITLHSRFGNETLGDEVKVGFTYTKENGSRDNTSMTPAKILVSFDPLLPLNVIVTDLQLTTLEFKVACFTLYTHCGSHIIILNGPQRLRPGQFLKMEHLCSGRYELPSLLLKC